MLNNICTSMLHRWRKRYTPTGEVSQMGEQQDELGRLCSRVAELEIEVIYNLKRAQKRLGYLSPIQYLKQ